MKFIFWAATIVTSLALLSPTVRADESLCQSILASIIGFENNYGFDSVNLRENLSNFYLYKCDEDDSLAKDYKVLEDKYLAISLNEKDFDFQIGSEDEETVSDIPLFENLNYKDPDYIDVYGKEIFEESIEFVHQQKWSNHKLVPKVVSSALSFYSNVGKRFERNIEKGLSVMVPRLVLPSYHDLSGKVSIYFDVGKKIQNATEMHIATGMTLAEYAKESDSQRAEESTPSNMLLPGVRNDIIDTLAFLWANQFYVSSSGEDFVNFDINAPDNRLMHSGIDRCFMITTERDVPHNRSKQSSDANTTTKKSKSEKKKKKAKPHQSEEEIAYLQRMEQIRFLDEERNNFNINRARLAVLPSCIKRVPLDAEINDDYYKNYIIQTATEYHTLVFNKRVGETPTMWKSDKRILTRAFDMMSSAEYHLMTTGKVDHNKWVKSIIANLFIRDVAAKRIPSFELVNERSHIFGFYNLYRSTSEPDSDRMFLGKLFLYIFTGKSELGDVASYESQGYDCRKVFRLNSEIMEQSKEIFNVLQRDITTITIPKLVVPIDGIYATCWKSNSKSSSVHKNFKDNYHALLKDIHKVEKFPVLFKKLNRFSVVDRKLGIFTAQVNLEATDRLFGSLYFTIMCAYMDIMYGKEIRHIMELLDVGEYNEKIDVYLNILTNHELEAKFIRYLIQSKSADNSAGSGDERSLRYALSQFEELAYYHKDNKNAFIPHGLSCTPIKKSFAGDVLKNHSHEFNVNVCNTMLKPADSTGEYDSIYHISSINQLEQIVASTPKFVPAQLKTLERPQFDSAIYCTFQNCYLMVRHVGDSTSLKAKEFDLTFKKSPHATHFPPPARSQLLGGQLTNYYLDSTVLMDSECDLPVPGVKWIYDYFHFIAQTIKYHHENSGITLVPHYSIKYCKVFLIARYDGDSEARNMAIFTSIAQTINDISLMESFSGTPELIGEDKSNVTLIREKNFKDATYALVSSLVNYAPVEITTSDRVAGVRFTPLHFSGQGSYRHFDCRPKVLGYSTVIACGPKKFIYPSYASLVVSDNMDIVKNVPEDKDHRLMMMSVEAAAKIQEELKMINIPVETSIRRDVIKKFLAGVKTPKESFTIDDIDGYMRKKFSPHTPPTQVLLDFENSLNSMYTLIFNDARRSFYILDNTSPLAPSNEPPCSICHKPVDYNKGNALDPNYLKFHVFRGDEMVHFDCLIGSSRDKIIKYLAPLDARPIESLVEWLEVEDRILIDPQNKKSIRFSNPGAVYSLTQISGNSMVNAMMTNFKRYEDNILYYTQFRTEDDGTLDYIIDKSKRTKDKSDKDSGLQELSQYTIHKDQVQELARLNGKKMKLKELKKTLKSLSSEIDFL